MVYLDFIPRLSEKPRLPKPGLFSFRLPQLAASSYSCSCGRGERSARAPVTAIPPPFRVEMWDRHDQHMRWVISASSSMLIGHAALDVAIANFPGERFTLRNRALVIREHKPEAATNFVMRPPQELPR